MIYKKISSKYAQPSAYVISGRGLDLIKHYEGFSRVAYKCPAGLWTIGYGHLIKKAEEVAYLHPRGVEISEAEAEDLLLGDVKAAENAVYRLVRAPITQGQFDALVSFTYNLGAGALQRSSLLRKLNRSEYQASAREFSRWVFAGGRRLRGLMRRREDEAEMFLG